MDARDVKVGDYVTLGESAYSFIDGGVNLQDYSGVVVKIEYTKDKYGGGFSTEYFIMLDEPIGADQLRSVVVKLGANDLYDFGYLFKSAVPYTKAAKVLYGSKIR